MRKYLGATVIAVAIVGLIFSLGAAGSSKYSKYAWLGVLTQSVDHDLTEAFDLAVEYGAIINEVLPDSPADGAGLEEDDIIIEFDGEKVFDSDDLIDLIDDSKPDDEVELVVMRDDNRIEVNVTLGKRPRSYFRARTSYHRFAPIPPKPPKPPKIGKSFLWDTYCGGSYIGVTLTSLTDQLGEYFGVKKGKGVLITGVEEDSPASEAGLKAGDVIISVDDEEVHDFSDVKEIIKEKEEGEAVAVTVLRDRKEKSFDVEVAEREDEAFDYSYLFSVPDFKVRIPKMKSLYFGDFDDWDDFDLEEFEEGMEELAEEMEDLKKELKGLQKEKNREDLRKQLRELRDELKELRKKIE